MKRSFFSEAQILLLPDSPPDEPNEKVFAGAFRRLYFHLYSNSNASRAERIIADLSNLLLCKIAAERNGGNEAIEEFISGKGTANALLGPLLRKAFPHLVSEAEPFGLQDDALRHGLRDLAPLCFHTAPAHILGEAFQALMGPRLRGDKGQFFTPKSLVRAMIGILKPRPGSKVVDPACGTGGFLVEAYAKQETEPVNPHGKLIGMDKDSDLCRLAEASLKIAADGKAHVWNVNSLDIAGLSSLPANVSPLEADYVLTNPPFGAKIKVAQHEILSQFALGHVWSWTGAKWLQGSSLRDAQDPQILFVELCVRLLKPGGEMGIVLPEGVFGNTGLGYVWDWVRSQGRITALLDCPRTTFQPSTDTKTNVLFFQKYRARGPRSEDEKVWTAVALTCGHDRRGRDTLANGGSHPDDLTAIGATFAKRKHVNPYWQLRSVTNPYYLVPRYYDQTPQRELSCEAERLGAELLSLGQMVELGYLRIRKGQEVGAEAYGTGDYPFVRTSDIANYEVSIDPTRSVSEDVYREYSALQKLRPGDLLLVSDGRYRIGRAALLNEHNFRCVVQSHIRILSVTRKCPITSLELLYLLSLPMVAHQIRNLVFIQSTLGALGRRLYEIRVPVPKRTSKWLETVEEFGALVNGRAKLLERLEKFEHPGYEL